MPPPSSSHQACIKSFLLNLSSSFQPNGENSWLHHPQPYYLPKVNCAIYQTNHRSKIYHIHSPKEQAGPVHERGGQFQWPILEFCLPQREVPSCMSFRHHKTWVYFCLVPLTLEVATWTTRTASDWSRIFNLFFQTQQLKNWALPPSDLHRKSKWNWTCKAMGATGWFFWRPLSSVHGLPVSFPVKLFSHLNPVWLRQEPRLSSKDEQVMLIWSVQGPLSSWPQCLYLDG